MFKITIEEERVVTKVLPKHWAILGAGPEGEHGYTPEVETRQTETVSVYQQCVATLDIVAVINAVNGVGK